MVFDVTIPHDDNLVKAEKLKKKEELPMWDVNASIIVPIVVSVNRFNNEKPRPIS